MKIKRVTVRVPLARFKFAPTRVWVDGILFKTDGYQPSPDYADETGLFVHKVYVASRPAPVTAVNRVIEGVIIQTLNASVKEENDAADSKALISQAARVLRLGPKRRLMVQYESFIRAEIDSPLKSFIEIECKYGHHISLENLFVQNAFRIEGELLESMEV